eukprot:TRINITY_DN1134_c1_g1_i1.p1 TRINITY_DN1134_c1_g1~~TRINITY_DN1134_c1_g1_i1.p1  ORF type:complete len:376 (+),score=32.59 TRINITY_DN1134_c1_g1_i1:108-1130(+)
MVKMAIETLAVTTMGTSLGSFTNKDGPSFPAAFQGVIYGVFDLFCWPEVLWPFLIFTKRKIKRYVQMMHKVVDDIIQKRVRNETRSITKQTDLLDLMLKDESGPKLSDIGIRSQVLGILFAGHDSTAAAMSSFFVFMIANPRVEAKLVDEIRHVVGDEELTTDHISKLTYLDWCIKETLRLLPPASNVERISVAGDLMLAGKWKIHRKEAIIIDMFTLHMDPETWGPDAAEFVPERWEKGAPHPYSYMPFATGPRGCIGKEFTLLEQKIVAVKILQTFELHGPAAGSWKPRTGCNIVKACDTMSQPPKIGIDVEYNPKQFFTGASLPVRLTKRQGRVAGP